RQKPAQNFSANTATIRCPSLVASAWYGTTDACPVPCGPGTRPSVQKYCAMYVSSETWQSSNARSRYAPFPVRARWNSAPARTKVVPDDVGDADGIEEHRASIVTREIDRDRLLVAIDREEVGGLAVGHERRPHRAHGIAALGIFDLDDVRAHVREQQRAVWS